MSAALQYEYPDPVAQARARYRGELTTIVDELAAELGYAPGAMVRAARDGRPAESDDVADLLVVARLLA
jgi:hypothetical protein